jgi:hypothetical protein
MNAANQPLAVRPAARFAALALAVGATLTHCTSIPGDAGVTTPTGWDFHQGGTCRDGSPAGFYVHYSTAASSKLFIYLEGGGACDSSTFCSHNPANIQTVFSGGPQSQGQTILGSLTFATTGQVPYTAIPASGLTPAYSPGIFDFTNTANPFKDWSAVYVPYRTGEVHFGTLDDVDIPSDGVLPSIPVAVIMDSGLPFRDMYLPPCMAHAHQRPRRRLPGLGVHGGDPGPPPDVPVHEPRRRVPDRRDEPQLPEPDLSPAHLPRRILRGDHERRRRRDGRLGGEFRQREATDRRAVIA